MADLNNQIEIQVLTEAKNAGNGILKLVNDLKQLRSGMNVSVEGIKSLSEQFKELGINISSSKLKDSLSKLKSDTLKYVGAGGQMVTINRKLKDGSDEYAVSIKRMNNELNKGTSLWSAFTKGISGSIVKARIIYDTLRDVTDKMSNIVKGASEYEEALNLFTVSMGENAEAASQWVERFSTALYLDPANVMQYMGSLNSLISGLGVGADKSYLMSKNLTQLAYDLASFKNLKFEEAFTKLQSGISGEIEPLRNVGVALSQNTLQELANSLGIKTRVAEMSEAQKAQLRYIQILKSTTQWQGDMGRTLVSPANAIRVIREQFSLLGRAIGRIFIPMIMKAIPYVMALTEILTDLANRIAKFLGYEFTDIDYSSLGNISAGIKDIGDEATDTTKKLNTMLAPFDELNVVQTKSASDGGLGTNLGTDLGLDLPEYDALAGLTDQFKKNVEGAKENLNKLFDIASKLAIVLGGLWVTDKLIKYHSALKELFSGTKTGTSLFSKLVTTFKKVITNFKTGYSTTKTLSGGLKNLWDNTSTLNKGLLGATGLIAGTVGASNSMKNLANQTKGTGEQIGKFALGMGSAVAGGAALGSIIPGVGTAVGALAGGLVSAVGGLFGFNEGINQLREQQAKEDLFGNLNISVSSFKDILDRSGPSFDSTNTKINELTSAIQSNGESFKKNLDTVDTYLWRFGTFGQVITDEYSGEIVGAFNDLFEDANTIIDTSTQRSLEIWTNMFKGMSTVSVEEQANILQTITDNGEFQKKEIANAQTRINEIYTKASNDRRHLNQGELDEINELLAKIDRLTTERVTETEVDLYTMRQKFSDKNYQLDDQSYNNYIEARNKYEEEQRKIINKSYLEALADADVQANTLLEKLKQQGVEEADAIKQANELKETLVGEADAKQTDSLNKMNEYIEKQNGLLISTLKTKYTELRDATGREAGEQRSLIEGIFKKLDPSILNDLKDQTSTAGYTTGTKFAEKFLDAAKNKFDRNQFNFSVNTSKPGAYAEGGFPQEGEFFVARENGPEMVGRIGNKAAVANNDQITTSITNAIITAFSGFNFGQQQPNTTVINIGGKKIYEGMGDHVDSENDRYGTNYIHV